MKRTILLVAALLAGGVCWADVTNCILTLDITNKTASVSSVISIRETVNCAITGIGASSATNLVVRIVKGTNTLANADRGTFTAHGAAAYGALDLNTSELVAYFVGLQPTAVRDFTVAVWDVALNRLLLADGIQVQNNPYDPSMPGPSPVGAYYMDAANTNYSFRLKAGNLQLYDISDGAWRNVMFRNGAIVAGVSNAATSTPTNLPTPDRMAVMMPYSAANPPAGYLLQYWGNGLWEPHNPINLSAVLSNFYWGAITGTLSDQTDLNARLSALDAGTNALDVRARLLEVATNALDVRAAALEGATGALQVARVALEGATNALNVRAGEVETATNALQVARLAMEGATNALDVRAGALETDTNALNVRALALESATNVLQVARLALESATNSIQTQVTNNLALQALTNSGVEGRLVAAEGATNSLAGRVLAVEGATNALNVRAGSAEGATNALNTRAVALESATNTLQAARLALEGSTNALDIRQTATEAATNALNVRAGALESATNALNSRAGSVETATNALNARAVVLEAATNALNARSGALETATNALNTRAGALEVSTNALQAQVTTRLPLAGGIMTGPATGTWHGTFRGNGVGLTNITANATNETDPVFASASNTFAKVDNTNRMAALHVWVPGTGANIAGLVQGCYTGNIVGVGYTGVTAVTRGRVYSWGFEKVNANGVATLSLASATLTATAAGLASNEFVCLDTNTALILTLTGTGDAKSDVSNVFVRALNQGYAGVAASMGVGSNLYVGGEIGIGTSRLTQAKVDSIGSAIDISDLNAATNALNARAGLLEVATNALHVRAGALETSTNSLNTRAGTVEGATNALNTRAVALEGATNALNTRAGAVETATNVINARVSSMETPYQSFSGTCTPANVEGGTSTVTYAMGPMVRIYQPGTNITLSFATAGYVETNGVQRVGVMIYSLTNSVLMDNVTCTNEAAITTSTTGWTRWMFMRVGNGIFKGRQ